MLKSKIGVTGLILFFVIVVLDGCSIMGYDTLEEAVQSRWDTPIKVINQDNENNLMGTLSHEGLTFLLFE